MLMPDTPNPRVKAAAPALSASAKPALAPASSAASLGASFERIEYGPAVAPAVLPDSVSFERIAYGESAVPADSRRSEVRKRYTMDTSDIVAVGILVLAIAAAFVAIIVAMGFVFGKVTGADAAKIVATCVGGSTISGVVAALVGRKSKPSRST